jgi:protein TonB
MEPNKILSASLIDVIFDGRNKEYGAYELRKNDSKRTKAALSVTIAMVAVVLTGTSLANSFKKEEKTYRVKQVVELQALPDEKPPEKLPEPVRRPEEPQVQTQKFTPPAIVPDEDFDEPPPSIDQLVDHRIDLDTKEGIPDDGTPKGPQSLDDGTGIVEVKEKTDPDEIRTTVDVPAKFEGNWIRFLQKNLNADVPVENGAGPGRYSVVVQFVVDKEGNVSDIKALTAHGYGVEEEAIRVLRKAPKWQAAIAAGYPVKAYHKQVIVFEVTGE